MDPWYQMKLIQGIKMERLGKYTEIEKDYICELRRDINREGIRWKFPNGYGASVAVNEITHFVPELAVIKFNEIGDSELVYDTPITGDVINNVGVGDTQSLLMKIKNLSGDDTV
jgi:hypothetical protein